MRETKNPSSYPLLIRSIQGYLVVSAVDFDLHLSERIENLSSESVGKMVLQLWKRIDQILTERTKHNLTIPPPSKDADPVLPQPSTNRWLNISDAARLLYLSPQTVRRLASSGKLPSRVSPGGHRRFLESEVKDYLSKSLKVGSDPSTSV